MLLEDSLRPLCRWLCYSGMANLSSIEERRFVRIVRSVFTVLIIIICTIFATVQFYQLVVAYGTKTKVDYHFFVDFFVNMHSILAPILKRYEAVFEMVNRANQLFRVMIVLNQFISLTNSCIFLYAMLVYFSVNPYFASAILSVFISVVIRIVLCNHLMSNLQLSSVRLQSSTTRLLSQQWGVLPEPDHSLLLSFQARIDRGDMIACPLNLYTVTPSNLLTILALVFNNVLILLQSASSTDLQ